MATRHLRHSQAVQNIIQFSRKYILSTSLPHQKSPLKIICIVVLQSSTNSMQHITFPVSFRHRDNVAIRALHKQMIIFTRFARHWIQRRRPFTLANIKRLSHHSCRSRAKTKYWAGQRVSHKSNSTVTRILHVGIKYSMCDLIWRHKLLCLNWSIGTISVYDIVIENLERETEIQRNFYTNFHLTEEKGVEFIACKSELIQESDDIIYIILTQIAASQLIHSNWFHKIRSCTEYLIWSAIIILVVRHFGLRTNLTATKSACD